MVYYVVAHFLVSLGCAAVINVGVPQHNHAPCSSVGSEARGTCRPRQRQPHLWCRFRSER